MFKLFKFKEVTTKMSHKKQVDMDFALQTLKKYFGHTSFLHPQEEIIKDVLQKNDVFVLMPTSGGKSLCFQLPALLMDGMTVVVSPLISLMKDQVDSLQANGIEVAYLNSSLKYSEIRDIKVSIVDNRIKILYVAPERLMMSDTFDLLKNANVGLVAIDEAHCISEWGHDFRHAYRKLGIIKKHLPKASLIAMTATATPEVQSDIVKQLKLANPKYYNMSLNRDNLFYQVELKYNEYDKLTQYLKDHNKNSGIIFCRTKIKTEDLADKLQSDGYRALPYHAGLSSNLRKETQEKFVKGDVEIIVATTAFGMGIDKSNIRFVIHNDMPKNLESYYQETGRAGRDGVKSDCILFYKSDDYKMHEYLINKKEDEVKRSFESQKLNEMKIFCESTTCRRKILLNYFNEDFNKSNCKCCDICIGSKIKKSLSPTKKQRDKQYQIIHQHRRNAERIRIQNAQTMEDIPKSKKVYSSEEKKILAQMEKFKALQKQYDKKVN